MYEGFGAVQSEYLAQKSHKTTHKTLLDRYDEYRES